MNGLGEGKEMRKESLQAYVRVIPKEGKDATLCLSYRPIAFFKCRYKVIRKGLNHQVKRAVTRMHPCRS